MTESKRVGILGSGDVGQQLGRAFGAHGYNVKLGTRETKKVAAWLAEAPKSRTAGSFAEAAAFGDPVVLATHGQATETVLDLAGPAAFAGKLVLDATNPLDFSHGMPPGLSFGMTDSLGERVQRKLAGALVVKCFNTVSNGKMVNPTFAAGPARMWICGNDAGAKRRTEAILRELGWAGALDIGGIDGARWLEAMVPLWVRVGQALGTYNHLLQPIQ